MDLIISLEQEVYTLGARRGRDIPVRLLSLRSSLLIFDSVLLVRHLIENDLKSFDVKRDIYEDYQKQIDDRAKNMIWEEGLVTNYYTLNGTGRSNINVPFRNAEYYNNILQPNLDDFKFD